MSRKLQELLVLEEPKRLRRSSPSKVQVVRRAKELGVTCEIDSDRSCGFVKLTAPAGYVFADTGSHEQEYDKWLCPTQGDMYADAMCDMAGGLMECRCEQCRREEAVR